LLVFILLPSSVYCFVGYHFHITTLRADQKRALSGTKYLCTFIR